MATSAPSAIASTATGLSMFPPLTAGFSSRRRVEIVAMRHVPWNHQAFDEVHGSEKQHSDQREHRERREHERQVEIAVGDLQQVTDSRVRTHKLAHDRTDDSERYRDLETGKDRRQRVWQADAHENL